MQMQCIASYHITCHDLFWFYRMLEKNNLRMTLMYFTWLPIIHLKAGNILQTFFFFFYKISTNVHFALRQADVPSVLHLKVTHKYVQGHLSASQSSGPLSQNAWIRLEPGCPIPCWSFGFHGAHKGAHKVPPHSAAVRFGKGGVWCSHQSAGYLCRAFALSHHLGHAATSRLKG